MKDRRQSRCEIGTSLVWLLCAAFCALGLGCSIGETSPGPAGPEGRPGKGVTVAIQANPLCPGSGISVQGGPDEDGDGTPDPGFETTVEAFCSAPGPQGPRGDPGVNSLLDVQTNPNAACAGGQLVVHSGVDQDGNNVLDQGERLTTAVICAPAPPATWTGPLGTAQLPFSPTYVPLSGHDITFTPTRNIGGLRVLWAAKESVDFGSANGNTCFLELSANGNACGTYTYSYSAPIIQATPLSGYSVNAAILSYCAGPFTGNQQVTISMGGLTQVDAGLICTVGPGLIEVTEVL